MELIHALCLKEQKDEEPINIFVGIKDIELAL